MPSHYNLGMKYKIFLAIIISFLTLAGAAHAQFVEPNSYYVTPGDNISFSGSQFAPSEFVAIFHGQRLIDIAQANTSGNFTSAAYQTPYSAGDQNYTFWGLQSGSRFTVTPTIGPASTAWILLSSYYAPAGTVVSATGRGFGSNEQVYLYYDNAYLGRATTNEDGQFRFAFQVPAIAETQHVISARGLATGFVARETFSRQIRQ